MWNKRQKIPLSHNGNHFVFSDLRKFAEQYGDVIGWEQSNRALFSHMGFQELTGSTISIPYWNMCMRIT